MFMQPGENKTDCNQICDLANGDQMKALALIWILSGHKILVMISVNGALETRYLNLQC